MNGNSGSEADLLKAIKVVSNATGEAISKKSLLIVRNFDLPFCIQETVILLKYQYLGLLILREP